MVIGDFIYNLFTLRRAHSPWILNGEQALLGVNRLYMLLLQGVGDVPPSRQSYWCVLNLKRACATGFRQLAPNLAPGLTDMPTPTAWFKVGWHPERVGHGPNLFLSS